MKSILVIGLIFLSISTASTVEKSLTSNLQESSVSGKELFNKLQHLFEQSRTPGILDDYIMMNIDTPSTFTGCAEVTRKGRKLILKDPFVFNDFKTTYPGYGPLDPARTRTVTRLHSKKTLLKELEYTSEELKDGVVNYDGFPYGDGKTKYCKDGTTHIDFTNNAIQKFSADGSTVVLSYNCNNSTLGFARARRFSNGFFIQYSYSLFPDEKDAYIYCW